MHRVGKKDVRQAAAYIACGCLLVVADILFMVQIARAAPAYTPYANSVTAQSGLQSGTANNAVGEPNGQNATLLGLNAGLTLDMGDGEEGTNALKAYFGPVNVQALIRVEFLNDDQTVLKSEERQLFFNLAASTQTFTYDWHATGSGYRFVRLTSLVGIAFGIDAVEALGFVGSTATQDTDGDGTPDRQDADPLVTNNPAGGGGSSGGSQGGGTGSGSSNSSATTTTTSTTVQRVGTTAGSGATTTANNLPSSGEDKDGDQMADAWEVTHGLDPNSKIDGLEDTDKDGLLNIQEYQYDVNPRNNDTDADGIPDGWEVDHGLNAKVDDAEEDPDGDFVTNRGEAYFDVNPYRSDEFKALAAKIENRAVKLWSWAVFGILLTLALLSFMSARNTVFRRLKK